MGFFDFFKGSKPNTRDAEALPGGGPEIRDFECMSRPVSLLKIIAMKYVQTITYLVAACLVLIGIFPAVGWCAPQSTDEDNLRYVWSVDGITIYQQPDVAADSVGYVGYGETVTVGEAVKAGPVDEENYPWRSKWVQVDYNGTTGFMLDAFLSGYPAPDRAGLPMFLDEYLGSLSPVVSGQDEGQTDEFCAKRTRHFENGIFYESTDFGPCEQCGHIRESIFFPSATKEEVLMMAVYFEFQYEGMQPELLRAEGNTDGTQWVVAYEYGQIKDIQLQEQEEGVLLIKDIML